MQITVTEKTDKQAIFTVSLSEVELKSFKAEVYDELRGRVKAAGFRPGKAPDAIVERELGSGSVQAEVVDHALQHSYSQAIRQENLKVVASPQVSIVKFVPYTELEYKATVELLPKVKLGNYKKLGVKRAAVKVDPKEIDQAVHDLRRREAARLESEQPARLSDEVNFDFEGTRDGQPVQGASAKNQTLELGSGQFIPGFEDQLVGLKKGEEKTFDIRFPKEYHEKSLAHKVVTFKVKINSITQLVLPELNQDFVEKVSPFKSLDELKGDIASKLTGEKAEKASREHESAVLDKLVKESKFDAPQALVRQQISRMEAEVEQNLASSGLDITKYLELTGKKREDFENEMRPEAERRVGLAMILTEVAAAEKLTVSKDELDAEIARLKQAYQDPAAQAELNNPETREEVYNHLMASKVIAKLISYTE